MTDTVKRFMLLAIAVTMLTASQAEAQLELRAGTQAGESSFTIGQGTNQQIGLFISNPDSLDITGFGLNLVSSNMTVPLQFDVSSGLFSAADLKLGVAPLAYSSVAGSSVAFLVDGFSDTSGQIGTLLLDSSSLSDGDIFTLAFTSGLGDSGFTTTLGDPLATTIPNPVTVTVSTVPEPSSFVFLAVSGLAFIRRRRS